MKVRKNEFVGSIRYVQKDYAIRSGVRGWGEGNFRVEYDNKRDGWALIIKKKAKWIYEVPIRKCQRCGETYKSEVDTKICSKCFMKSAHAFFELHPPKR